MNIKIIDAHTHVQFEQYDKDREEIINRASLSGIGMINAGADLKSSIAAVELAHSHEGLWATVGLHPHEAGALINADENTDKRGYISNNQRENQHKSAMRKIEMLAQDEKVVGIGECGMDLYARTDADVTRIDADKQIKLFERHISLAHRVKKPLVIHCRQAFDETFDLLTAHRRSLLSNAGIFHFFTGDIERADTAIGLGFSFTFGGLVTFNREFDEVIKHIPLEQILVETDAPFVAPKSHRGQRNEPSYVAEVIPSLATIKSLNEEEVRRQVLENTKKIFNI